MTISTALKDILVSAVRGSVELEGVTITHSAFPAPIHITGSIHPGFTGTPESGPAIAYVYMPIRINRASQSGNLAQRFEMTFQDLNTVIAPYIDLIPIDSNERPQIVIRSFVYNPSGASPLADGPYRLQAADSAFTPEGFKVTATPRNVNSTGTGRKMTVQRYPMLRGFTK